MEARSNTEPREIVEALNDMVEDIENAGISGGTEKRQLREVKKGAALLKKIYGEDGGKKLTDDSKKYLKQLGFALDQRDFKLALAFQVKLAGSKDWKKHKNWIKPLKFCIELAKKKFS